MNSALTLSSTSDEETQAFGRQLAKHLPVPGVALLIGALGTGKTTLAKGIVEGCGLAVAADVSSPTYTLIHEYGHPVGIYHIDLYRLDTVDEVRRLGLEDLFEQRTLLLIEWGERFPELWPAAHIEIRLVDEGDDQRTITVSGLNRSVQDI